MYQDPNSNYGSNPQNPYGPNPQNPYDTPSSPYQPYGPSPSPDPANPYGAGNVGGVPGAPTPPPSGYPPMYPAPNQPGYGYPPPNQGYGPGQPGYPPAGQMYGPGQQGYGYNQPPASPLPLKQAIRELPRQYWRVLSKPSPQTIAGELGKAEWGIVWVEIVIYAVLCTVIRVLTIHLNPAYTQLSSMPITPGNPMSPALYQNLLLTTSLSTIVWLPAVLFIEVGIYYLLARAFKGQGTFLQQMYGTLLIVVPIGLASVLLQLIPFLGWLAVFALAIYSLVLNIFMLMAVHRLSGGRATLVFFIPIIVALLLACIIGAVFAVFIASVLQSAHP